MNCSFNISETSINFFYQFKIILYVARNCFVWARFFFIKKKFSYAKLTLKWEDANPNINH